MRILSFLILTLISTSCGEQKSQNARNHPRLDLNDTVTDVKTHKAELELEAKATLGEGPIWNHLTQQLYWVDIENQQLHRYSPSAKKDLIIKLPSRIGTVVPIDSTNAVIALQDGIYTINLLSENLKLLSEVERDIPTNRFNDGKCDPSGRLWVGSMALNETPNAASLYMVKKDGSFEKKRDGVTISNGIVWTKDAQTMYYIDTPTQNVVAFDFDNLSGNLSNERIAMQIPDSLGHPDGMTIDENDHLWIGLWNGNSVIQIDPKAGKILSKVEVPAHNVTACAFGGQHLDTLYITTASVDMNDSEKEKFPLAGSIFKVVPGVKGVPANFFGNE